MVCLLWLLEWWRESAMLWVWLRQGARLLSAALWLGRQSVGLLSAALLLLLWLWWGARLS